MEVLSEHLCQGWLEGYLLTGRHGLFYCYEAFIHIVDSMFNQHAKWLKVRTRIPWRQPIASLNYLLSSHVWRQDHNGFSHQDPGFIDHVVNKKAEIIRVYLPPDANTLLSTVDHCLRSTPLRQRDRRRQAAGAQLLDDGRGSAALHARTRHLGLGDQRRRRRPRRRARLLRRHPDARGARRRVAAARAPARSQGPGRQRRRSHAAAGREHPHGLSDREFDTLFTTDTPSSSPITATRSDPSADVPPHAHDNIHVRGYKEEGTTTTPFDMVVLNDMDRFHLVIDVIDRVPAWRRAALVRQDDGRRPARAAVHARARRGSARGPRLDLAGLTASPAVRVLVVNAGSSSLKLRVLDEPTTGDAAERGARRATADGRSSTPRCVRRGRPSGRARRSPVRRAVPSSTTPDAVARLAVVARAAAPTLRGRGYPRRAAARSHLPQVACFDTAFHATIRPRRRPTRPAGVAGAVRACVASVSTGFRTRTLTPRPELAGHPIRRVVTCHLGAGSSSQLRVDGRCVDTTMGFTPNEGVRWRRGREPSTPGSCSG